MLIMCALLRFTKYGNQEECGGDLIKRDTS
jgi:hypothetical protein